MAETRPKAGADSPAPEQPAAPVAAPANDIKGLPLVFLALAETPASPLPAAVAAATAPQEMAVVLPVASPAPESPKNPFNARAVMAEAEAKSAYPRVWKDSGFEKFMRLVGLGDIVDAMRQRKNKAHHVSQAVTTKIGFGDIYRAAAQPKGRVRATLKAIGSKMADMAAGRVVSGSFKLVAITFVAGMLGGVSGWGSIVLLALATGASSAIYTYGKAYVTERFSGPPEKRAQVKIFDRQRSLDALKAFASGTANGLFGAWLAKLPIFQSTMKLLHDTIHRGIGQISGSLSDAGVSTPQPESFFSRHITSHFRKAAGRHHVHVLAATPEAAPRPAAPPSAAAQ